jgi:hypothetical protein
MAALFGGVGAIMPIETVETRAFALRFVILDVFQER